MAVWLSRNNIAPTEYLIADMLNSLANDDRLWGGNVNGGGYTLSNVLLSKVNVGNSPSTAGIAAHMGTLAPSVGAGLYGLSLSALTNNYDELLTAAWRQAAGSAWDTAIWRTGRYVDSSLIAFMDYGVHRLAFGVDNGERMCVTATGVGIGTQFPDALLTVVGGGARITQDVSGGGYSSQLLLTGTDTRKFLALSFDTSANVGRIDCGISGVSWNPLLICPNGGNVGIGTTAPSALLSLQTGAGVATVLDLTQLSHARWIISIPASVGALTFSQQTSEYMRITNAGNVGIGTSNPPCRLCVTAPSAAFAADGIASHFQLTTGTGGQLDDKLYMGVVDGTHSWIQAQKPGTAARKLLLQPGGGNVGISNSNPGYQLDVTGTINATSYLLSGVPHLATLAAGPDDLPPDGGLNLWLDEAAGRIAVRYRNPAGVLKTGYISIE